MTGRDSYPQFPRSPLGDTHTDAQKGNACIFWVSLLKQAGQIFGKPGAVVFNGFCRKQPVSKIKMFLFCLNAFKL